MTYEEVFKCTVVQINLKVNMTDELTPLFFEQTRNQARYLRLREDLDMDSLDIVELMLDIEDALGVELKDDTGRHLEPRFTLDEFVKLYAE